MVSMVFIMKFLLLRQVVSHVSLYYFSIIKILCCLKWSSLSGLSVVNPESIVMLKYHVSLSTLYIR